MSVNTGKVFDLNNYMGVKILNQGGLNRRVTSPAGCAGLKGDTVPYGGCSTKHR